MAVLFKQVGNTARFTACAAVKTKLGVLKISVVETQQVPNGRLNGVLQIALNGKPLLISSSSVLPRSAGCNRTTKPACACKRKPACPCKKAGSCRCKKKARPSCIRSSFRAINGNLVNQLSPAILAAFRRLRRQILAFRRKNTVSPNLPCFIVVPVCRVTEARVVLSCRASGKSMLDCVREGEEFYNRCKGDC